jgi:hypothetical protein
VPSPDLRCLEVDRGSSGCSSPWATSVTRSRSSPLAASAGSPFAAPRPGGSSQLFAEGVQRTAHQGIGEGVRDKKVAGRARASGPCPRSLTEDGPVQDVPVVLGNGEQDRDGVSLPRGPACREMPVTIGTTAANRAATEVGDFPTALVTVTFVLPLKVAGEIAVMTFGDHTMTLVARAVPNPTESPGEKLEPVIVTGVTVLAGLVPGAKLVTFGAA